MRFPHRVPWLRPTTSSTGRLVFLSAVVGVIGGLGAQIYIWLLHYCSHALLQGIAGYTPPGIPTEGGSPVEVVGPFGLWLVPVATGLGGLLSGFLVYRFAPEAEGHGTDAAIQAYHERGGAVRARVPIVKAITSAITIGSGGAAGREGPVAQISSGFGSTMAAWLGCSPRERRLLTLAGISAGLSAVFRSPLGTAVFAVEVLYSSMEFEARALIFTIMAAVVGYAVNGAFVGFEPIFLLPEGLTFDRVETLVWFGILGVLMGFVGSVVPTIYYKVHALFSRMPGPRALRPALGGLLMGLLAIAVPQVMGGGYGWTQMALDGDIAIGLLLLIAVAKTLAMSLTVASGGSGGIFAPSLMVGTVLGAAVAMTVNRILPTAELSVAAFGVVGMAAFFSGAARVPIATMLMVVEMTGGYGLLVPAMLAVLMSYLVESTVTRGWRWPTLYINQVASRADSPVHHEEYTLRAMDLIRMGKARLPLEATPVRLVNLLQLGTPIPIGGTGRSLCRCRVRDDAPGAGKPLSAKPFGDKISLLSIMRKGEVIDPTPTTVCLAGDDLICLLSPEAFDLASDSLELVGRSIVS
jgi:CIC family chloride channel protein